MFGVSILLVLLAIGAGILGFGGLVGTLTTLAVIAFYVFIALLIVSLIARAVGGAAGRGGALGALVVVVLAAGGVYYWSQHRGALGGGVKAATADATDAFKQTDAKAKQVVGEVARSARAAIDERKRPGDRPANP